MQETPETPTDRIDPDHYERSPSTGPRETAVIFHAVDGFAHTLDDDRDDPIDLEDVNIPRTSRPPTDPTSREVSL